MIINNKLAAEIKTQLDIFNDELNRTEEKYQETVSSYHKLRMKRLDIIDAYNGMVALLNQAKQNPQSQYRIKRKTQ